MKTLERQFFRYCCKQFKYDSLKNNIISFRSSIEDIVEQFSNKKNCNEKQLYYYLFKWANFGFFKEGQFLLNKIPERYNSIIPARCRSLLIRKSREAN